MERFFIDAEQKNVSYILLYGHSDNKLYHDKTHKVAVTKAELDPVVYDRILVEVSGKRYIPVNVTMASEDELVIIANSSTTPSAATYKTNSGK